MTCMLEKRFILIFCISQISDEGIQDGRNSVDELEESVVYYNHTLFPNVVFFLAENNGKITLSASKCSASIMRDFE